VPPKELSVFDAEHPRPKDELDAAKLRAVMTKRSDEQMAKLLPRDAESLKEFRRVVGGALEVMVGSSEVDNLHFYSPDGDGRIGNVSLSRSLVGRASGTPPELKRDGDDVPYIEATRGGKASPIVVWVHPQGKASLVQRGKWRPAATALLDRGASIFALDVLGTGEQVGEKPYPVDKNYAGYTFGYNRSLLANRVHDVLTVTAAARLRRRPVWLIGWGEMGPVAILAKSLAGDSVARVAADLNQFRFENIKDTADPMMLPGAVKYGGLPAFLALCAPGEVLIHNHKGTASGKLAKAAYDAAGASDKLTLEEAKLDDLKVVEWLVR
jgi:hypothetical protein